MANPFLVLGGVAVGVVTAGIGVLQVPGWIDSANDSAVRSDLAQVAIGQEAAYTVAANYTDLAGLEDGTTQDNSGATVQSGVKAQTSAGVELAVATNADGDAWAAVGVSKSGHVFVRTSDSATIITSDEKFSGTETITLPGLPTGVTIGGTAAAPTIEIAG